MLILLLNRCVKVICFRDVDQKIFSKIICNNIYRQLFLSDCPGKLSEIIVPTDGWDFAEVLFRPEPVKFRPENQ